MLRPTFYYATALTTLALFGACTDGSTPDDDDSGGSAGTTAGSGGTTGGKGGQAGSGSSGGGTGGAGGTTGGVGGSTGGAGGVTGGAGGAGGVTGGVGGTVGGAGGVTGGVGGTVGGAAGTGGSVAGAGGSTGGSAGSAGSAPDVDQNGKMNAPPGTMTSMPQDYLRLGEIRIINNNWGSAELGCGSASQMSIFVDQDRTFGWNFNRQNCDTQPTNANPDFPQIEFGVHPFGASSPDGTSPDFSSTTLLPIQISAVNTMSVQIQNLQATFQQETSWNITFEFWISERDPLSASPGVYAELMTFWGWQNGRWPDPPNGTGPIGPAANNTVTSAGRTYTVKVHDDAWADGKWRYYQFRDNSGPQKSFNGTLDVKPFIEYLVTQRGYSRDFWISRLEVGSEIDDMTQGTVRLSGITFEVNQQTRSAIIGG